MANHHMLQVTDRPQWRVVRGGSSSYVRALTRDWRVDVRRGCAVRRVARTAAGVVVASDAGEERFDQAVLACHGDQALALLQDPHPAEREVLGRDALPGQRHRAAYRQAPPAARPARLGCMERARAGGRQRRLHGELLHEPSCRASNPPNLSW